MRCAACNTEVSTDAYLCGACKLAVYHTNKELEERETLPVPEFMVDEFLEQYDKMNHSWGEGLGLMDPEERHMMLMKKAFLDYQQARWDGKSPYRAIRAALGLHRGNLMFQVPGAARGGDTLDVNSGSSMGLKAETMFAGESVGLNEIWRD